MYIYELNYFLFMYMYVYTCECIYEHEELFIRFAAVQFLLTFHSSLLYNNLIC